MNGETGTEVKAKAMWAGILETAKKVITNPAEFYRSMPKTGGFGDPLIFMVVLALASGIVQALLGLLHLRGFASMAAALGMIIMTPIMVAIFGFVGAAILFVIWKLMGSQESYETAYRCAAYAMAISPITALIRAIPYLGAVVGLAWMTFLLVNASEHVHRIKRQTAWLVFGIIAAVFALASISSEVKMRRFARRMENWGVQAGKSAEEMTPEEAGQAAAAFLKGLQKEAEREAKSAESEE